MGRQGGSVKLLRAHKTRETAKVKMARGGMRSVLAVLLLLCSAIGPIQAVAQRDTVADALAGHQAEMDQLAGKDPMRRAFFFDPVAIESPDAGVPCDHLARRRPEAVAGRGRVVLLESAADPARRLRFWLSPDKRQDTAEQDAASYAKSAGFGAYRLIGIREFAWCR